MMTCRLPNRIMDKLILFITSSGGGAGCLHRLSRHGVVLLPQYELSAVPSCA